jgi:tellurite resistance protein TerC
MTWLNFAWDGHFPLGVSLAIIGGLLAASIGLSLAFPKPASLRAE